MSEPTNCGNCGKKFERPHVELLNGHKIVLGGWYTLPDDKNKTPLCSECANMLLSTACYSEILPHNRIIQKNLKSQ